MEYILMLARSGVIYQTFVDNHSFSFVKVGTLKKVLIKVNTLRVVRRIVILK